MSELKAIKVNRGSWLPYLAQDIERFCKRAPVEGIQTSNVQTYFARIAQFGGDASEFWVVLEDNKPVAFACWNVLDLPHISKVYCFAVHSWTKNKMAVEMLADEWIKFGQRWRAEWWSADFVGEAVIRLVESKMKKRGFEMKRSGIVNVVFRRVQNAV